MKRNAVFVIPFVLPWDWSADYQRQTCLALSKKHKVIAYMQMDAIFFLKAFLKKSKVYPNYKNILFYQPIYLLPLRRFLFIEKINTRISFIMFQLSRFSFSNFILWVFDPCFYFMPKLTMSPSLYDCVDYHLGFHTGEFLRKIQRMERLLIHRVKYFFVNSNTLYNLHKNIRVPDAIVPQGFRLNDFKHPMPKNISLSGSKPIIGYVGAIDNRLDYTLLDKLIKNNPQWQFIFWGPISYILPASFYQKNVILGLSKDQKEIPSIIKQFTIGIIPYNRSILGVLYSYPMKLFEYFYIGKPVISTPIEELKRFPRFAHIGATTEEWEKQIITLLSKPWPQKNKTTQRKLAVKNSWEKKIEKTVSVIELGQRVSR